MSGIPNLSIPFAEGGLPPQSIWKTSDEYTQPTDLYFTIKSEKIVLQGHPYFNVKASGSLGAVPLVSPQQYRVFKLQLPEPNNFNISQQGAALSDIKYVWQLKGFKISREGPVRASTDMNVQFNPSSITDEDSQDYLTDDITPVGAQKLFYDLPAAQDIVVGCQPCLGIHFEPQGYNKGERLILRPQGGEIQDGDLAPMGFGALDIEDLKGYKHPVEFYYPSTMVNNQNLPPKSISDIDMDSEETGDRNFIHIKREQSYSKAFVEGLAANRETSDPALGTFDTVWNIPSGSVVSQLNDIFNKRYWMNRGEHQNNCLAWDDIFYFTILDNTRGQNLIVPCTENDDPSKNVVLAIRHMEVFQIEVVLRLVKVKLEAELIQYLYRMNKSLLNKWGYGWQRNNIPVQTQHEQKFMIGPEIPHPEPEEEGPEFRSITVEYNGRVHKDLMATDTGRHYKQFLNSELFTGKPTSSALKPRARAPAKRKK